MVFPFAPGRKGQREKNQARYGTSPPANIPTAQAKSVTRTA